MLIEKKADLKPNDVASVRLTTGEELIGKLIENNDAMQWVKVSKPVLLQMQMVSQTQAGIGFAPFMVGVDEDSSFTIPYRSLLVMPMKARQDIAANYIKATTGLAVPGGKGLIV